MAHGGHPDSYNPYLVGEEGPELYVPHEGEPEFIGVGGPEVMTFPQKGTIIPNDKLKLRAAVTGTPNVRPSMFSRENLYGLGLLNPDWKEKLDKLPARPPTPYGTIGSIPHNFRKHFALGPDSWANEPEEGYNNVPFSQPSEGVGQPQAASSGQSSGEGGWMNPYLESYQGGIGKMRSMYPSAMGVPINNYPPSPGESLSVQDLAEADRAVTQPVVDNFVMANPYINDIRAVRERMASPIMTKTARSFGEAPSDSFALSSPTDTTQSFDTPYGRAGVRLPPTRTESTIDGLPASEWFQRQANRGGANKFAKPEEGYHPERLQAQLAINERKRRVEKLPSTRAPKLRPLPARV